MKTPVKNIKAFPVNVTLNWTKTVAVTIPSHQPMENPKLMIVSIITGFVHTQRFGDRHRCRSQYNYIIDVIVQLVYTFGVFTLVETETDTASRRLKWMSVMQNSFLAFIVTSRSRPMKTHHFNDIRFNGPKFPSFLLTSRLVLVSVGVNGS